MIKYHTNVGGIEREVMDKDTREELVTELKRKLHEEKPRLLNQSFSYGSICETYGHMDFDMAAGIKRKAEIVRKSSGIEEVLTYEIFHRIGKDIRSISSTTKGEPKNCWLKDSFNQIKEKYGENK